MSVLSYIPNRYIHTLQSSSSLTVAAKLSNTCNATSSCGSVLSMSRPCWDETWMKIARTVADRSYDQRLNVGAIIVTEDNTRLLSLGYNGNYRGGPNTPDSDEPGMSGFIHAEINALLKTDFTFPSRKIMYVTHSPCEMCCKCIINAGINEVVYEKTYRNEKGLIYLLDAGVYVRQFKLVKLWLLVKL